MLCRNMWLGCGALVVVGAAACSGSTGSSVSSSEGGATDATSTSSGGEGGASGDDSGADGSWIIMGGSSSGTSSSSSSGATDGGGGRPLGDGGPNQIVCGAGGPCDSTNEVCCATAKGRTCTTAALCTGDVLSCSGSNSCSTGQVCCEEVSGLSIKTVCLAACAAGSPQLCMPGEGDCKRGDVCVRGKDGYATCVRIAGDGGAANDAGGSDAAGD